MTLKDIIHALNGLVHLPMWWAQRFHKRDPYLWTFDSWQGTRYTDNPRVLYEYILNNEPQIQCCWMTRNIAVYERLKAEGKPVAMCDSREGKRIQKHAGVFFSTHGNMNGQSEGDIRYMNGIRYVNLWHGAPLKQIGEDEQHFKRKKTIAKVFKTWCRRMVVPWEFLGGTMLCDSDFFLPFVRSAFGSAYSHILVAPEPRLDNLFAPVRETLITKVDMDFNNPVKVLYMPTFRDSQYGEFNPFRKAGFRQEALDRLLEEQNMVFFYKGHFLDRYSDNIQNSKRLITISDASYDDLYTFIKDVDILITDYSSIYFDFICLRKPIILFPFDLEEYMTHSRPFYFDYSLMEAKRVYSWQELIQCLADKTYHPTSEEELNRFRPMFVGGHCSENLVHQLKMGK